MQITVFKNHSLVLHKTGLVLYIIRVTLNTESDSSRDAFGSRGDAGTAHLDKIFIGKTLWVTLKPTGPYWNWNTFPTDSSGTHTVPK